MRWMHSTAFVDRVRLAADYAKCKDKPKIMTFWVQNTAKMKANWRKLGTCNWRVFWKALSYKFQKRQTNKLCYLTATSNSRMHLLRCPDILVIARPVTQKVHGWSQVPHHAPVLCQSPPGMRFMPPCATPVSQYSILQTMTHLDH